MRKLIAPVLAAIAAIALPAVAHAVDCTTNTPIDLTNLADVAVPGNAFAGTATCPDAPVAADNSGELLSIAAALSTPVWLETGERFAVSGGLGFSGDGDTAFGGTALMRIDGGLSAFAGGAVSTNHSDLWSGKVGVRAGF